MADKAIIRVHDDKMVRRILMRIVMIQGNHMIRYILIFLMMELEPQL